MAEKAEKKAEAKEAAAPPVASGTPAKKEGGGMGKTPVVIGVVMFIEAIVLFAGFKFLGGGAPKSAQAAEMSAEEGGGGHGGGDSHGGGGGKSAEKKKMAYLPVIEFRAPNSQRGRSIIFDVKIVAAVKGDHEEKAKTTLAESQALIQDRVRTIIAQSDPEKLSEPGLETLRRQVKYQLDEIVGEGMVDEVLVPHCIPYRADF